MREGVDPQVLHDEFFHVRVVVGMVVGLSIARLLNGLGRFIQHPKGPRPYAPHLLWTAFMLVAVTHFWWFEFGLQHVTRWSFPIYLYVVAYAALHFFTCVVLYPEQISDYDSWEGYFLARRGWLYGLVAALLVVDLGDTALKGADHWRALGPLYPWRQVVFATACIAAAFVSDRRFHLAFAALAVILEAWRAGREFSLAL